MRYASTFLMLCTALATAAPDMNITMREGGIVRGDIAVMAMDFETGVADDVTLTGNDGTVTAGIAFTDATATRDGFIELTRADSDKVTVVNSATVQDLHGGDFAISMWVNWTPPAGLSDQYHMLGTKYVSAAGFWFAMREFAHDYWLRGIVYYDGVDASSEINLTNAPAATNGWVHIVTAILSSNICYFIDGVEITNTIIDVTGSGAASTDAATPLLIGERSDGHYFDGSIDDVVIHRGTITATDALNIYLQGMPRHRH